MSNPLYFCAIIPSYRHVERIGAVISAARAQSLPVYVIDDGNAEPLRLELLALHDPDNGIIVHRLPKNSGKGVAVLAGFKLAAESGYSHAVQIDADGQHDCAALPHLINAARSDPEALISGLPQYDSSIPRGRAIGRWITHIWVWIETLSVEIRDSMCGFRVYPLKAVQKLVSDGAKIGSRMDFDTEIMVRLYWAGTPVRVVPVSVTYPKGNQSNFDMLHDNLRITAMHTRLALGMPLRLPKLLARKWHRNYATKPHWAQLPERGVLLGIRFCVCVLRLLGPRVTAPLLDVIAFYFFVSSTRRRKASLQYLARAFATSGARRQPSWLDGYRLFRNFSRRGLDIFAVWAGSHLPIAQSEAAALLSTNHARGAIMVVSHTGNVEVARAALSPQLRRRMLVLMHTKHAENVNRVLRELNPEASLNVLQVSEIGPETALRLAEHIENGGWIVIAGDRIPLAGERVSKIRFLGDIAAFPQGPYILSAILHCPIHALFCRRTGSGYTLHVATIADKVTLPRAQRAEALDAYAARYASLLEQEVLAAPHQWYNFFDFWAASDGYRT